MMIRTRRTALDWTLNEHLESITKAHLSVLPGTENHIIVDWDRMINIGEKSMDFQRIEIFQI